MICLELNNGPETYFEHIENGKLSVVKVTFGAEPKDYEVQEYILKYYFSLQFSPAVTTSRLFIYSMKKYGEDRERLLLPLTCIYIYFDENDIPAILAKHFLR